MPVNKLEALVDAIGKLNGANNPETECYAIRNPLMIRSFARPGKHEVNDTGIRVFNSWLSGLKASYFDIELKVNGTSRAGLKPTDSLESLLRVYGIKELGGINQVVSFLKRALKNDTLTRDTPLSYFQNSKIVVEE